jgi:hypothetical protein
MDGGYFSVTFPVLFISAEIFPHDIPMKGWWYGCVGKGSRPFYIVMMEISNFL